MTRIATFIACDEVANAGLGKFAYIGIYNADMLVPVLPYSLPQLFFVVRLRTPIDDPLKQLKIRIERPGRDPFVVDNSAFLEAPKAPGPDAKFLQAQAVVRIAPFEIDKEGTVKVFVEDETGDHYAGGLRLKVGVHPELSMPHVALSAGLIVGHYKRLAGCPTDIRQKTAAQLIESLMGFMEHSGIPIGLQFPKSDVRLLIDNERIHVFFPQPLDNDPAEINVEPVGNFDEFEIERTDRIGFVVRFAPSAPADAVFNYTVVEKPKEISRTAKLAESAKRKRTAKKSPE